MTIQQLQYILEVNRTGSITQAAKNLFVSQSSVSNAVSSLEAELGFAIFYRKWNGVIPTEQGIQALQYASHICENWGRMAEGRKPLQKEIRLHFAPHTPFSNAFVRLVTEREGTGSRFVHRNGGKAMDELNLQELDLVLQTVLSSNVRKMEYGLRDKGLEWQNRGRVSAVIRIMPAHPLYHKPELKAEDFRSYMLIDGRQNSMVRAGELCKAVDIDPEQLLLSEDGFVRHQLLARGLGYRISIQLPEKTREKLDYREIPLEGVYFHLFAVTNPLRPISPEVHRFLELVDEELAGVLIKGD